MSDLKRFVAAVEEIAGKLEAEVPHYQVLPLVRKLVTDLKIDATELIETVEAPKKKKLEVVKNEEHAVVEDVAVKDIAAKVTGRTTAAKSE
jgi:hypothetical protein